MLFIFLVKINSKKNVINAQKWDIVDAVETCDNNRRYADILIVSSSKVSVICPRFPKHNIKRKRWVKLISKARADFEPGCCYRVCSVHFPDNKPTSLNSDLTLFLAIQDNREKETKHAQFQR